MLNTYPQRIDFVPMNANGDIPEEVQTAYIEFHKSYFRFFCDMKHLVPINPEDDMMGYKEEDFLFDEYHKRRMVSSVTMKLISGNKDDDPVWGVIWWCGGGSYGLYFDCEEKGKEMLKLLLEWWL